MSQRPQTTGAGAELTWKRSALLLTAGLGSFVLAVAMQGKWQIGEPDLVLAAPSRVRLDATPRSPDKAKSPAGSDAQSFDVSMNTSSLRMNKMVVRDPFGPLAAEKVTPPEAAPPPAQPVAPGKGRKPPSQPASVQPMPPPPPTAPPLPFTAVGSIQGKGIGNGQQQAFIQQGDDLTIIQQGDTIANKYRVDEITNDRVVFTYLPLGQKQSLLLLDNSK